MTYQETLDWMFARLPMYQRKGPVAFRKDLANIRLFSKHLGEPYQSFKTIHVGGTNGKGSVSHMLASVFQEAGYKTGLYTSPHLKDYRERIKVNGLEIPEEKVTAFIATNQAFLEKRKLSFFEMTVGLAFDYFAEEKVDIAIIEVGLGGRLDATNIIQPEISVITNIGLDHTQFLGNTLPAIAREKAGIIKEKTPVVIGEIQKETTPVFKEVAAVRGAPIYFSDTNSAVVLPSDLKGKYQEKNKQTVLQTVKIAQSRGWKITSKNSRDGLNHVIRNTKLRGRWETINHNPKTICDTGHNKEGLQYVLQQLQEEKYRELHIVLGVVNDKDLDRILPLFPTKAHYYFAKPNIPRGMAAEKLKTAAERHKLHGNSYNSVSEAYAQARSIADKNDLLFIGGSTFTVAEII